MDKAPTDTTLPDYADWASQDCKACAQIALMLTDKPLNMVFQVQTVKQAWDCLMVCYEGKGEQKIAYLIIELFCSALSDDSPQINAMMCMANTMSMLGLPLHEKLITLAIIISLPPSYNMLKQPPNPCSSQSRMSSLKL